MRIFTMTSQFVILDRGLNTPGKFVARNTTESIISGKVCIASNGDQAIGVRNEPQTIRIVQKNTGVSIAVEHNTGKITSVPCVLFQEDEIWIASDPQNTMVAWFMGE